MFRLTAARSWLSTLAVAAALGAIVVDAAARVVRAPPRPSKRSRANDTPVRHHVVGGGPDGGMVHSIALAHTEPTRAFVALKGGGVYASSDRGVTWTPAERGLPPSPSWCDLVADPVAGHTLYAACEGGLFKTTDGGELWRQLDVDSAASPIIAPSDPRVLYEPPFGHLVYSRDGGRRWAESLWPRRSWESCLTNNITVDPLEASTLYCPSKGGVLVSRNKGVRWRSLPGRPVEAGVELIALAIAPADRRTMFVTADDGRVLKTTTGGATWTALSLPDPVDADDVRIIDRDGDIVYARQGERLVRSLDGGDQWEVLSVPWPAGSLSAYAVDAWAPDVIYAGTSAGIFVSTDGGRSWAARTRGITRAPTSVALQEGARATLFASVGRDVFASEDDGTSWSLLEWNADMEGIDGSTLTSDGEGGVVVRAGTEGFRLPRGSSAWMRDVVPEGSAVPRVIGRTVGGVRTLASRGQFFVALDNGAGWQSVTLPGGIAPSGVARVGRDRSVLVAGVDGPPAVMEIQSASLWRSVDFGETWQRVGVASERVLTFCCRLFVDANDADTVYAAVDEIVEAGRSAPDLLLRSVDAGLTWVRLQVPARLGAIAVLPTTPTTLLAQASGGEFVRSTDQGDHWTRSAAVLPDNVSVVGFAFDRRRPAVVFAATDSRGVYRSTDAGVTWQPTGRVR